MMDDDDDDEGGAVTGMTIGKRTELLGQNLTQCYFAHYKCHIS
jgi:hypothetical protein